MRWNLFYVETLSRGGAQVRRGCMKVKEVAMH